MRATRPVPALRAFSRFYTRKIGVLNSGFLGTTFSLPEGRVLYELARHPELTATDLVRALGIDAGYLSRLLARFERRRLITRRRSAHDARRSHLRLTPAGRKCFSVLDARSSRQAAGLLNHLAPHDRERLAGFLAGVGHLLASPEEQAGRITLRGLRPGDLGWVVQRHGVLYAAEYGWDQTGEAFIARIVADYGEHHDPRRERAWVAELDGHPVGCIFLVRAAATVGQLRLLLVEPSARGRGIGKRLVAACLDFARRAGYRKVRLWTNRVLHAARHLYEAAGFRLVHSERHHRFGHDLVGQTWELALT